MIITTQQPASSAPRKKTRRCLCYNIRENLDEKMKEMRLKRAIIISAFQADYQMMVGNVSGPAPGGEFRAFSPVMLWAMPIVLLSKAFSLLGYRAVYLVRVLSISLQAESLTYHNLGHRPRPGNHSRPDPYLMSTHLYMAARSFMTVHRPRLSATRSKRTAARSACRSGSEHLPISNYHYGYPAMLQKIS
ncbi:hypothetical protein SAMN05444280_11627 [Tangfeifania diversioriginum]|uniref:Uncharacterized protein n=1 Tax=Tangfeifania diversioriginum TaxID=1168035 RepID=A0A1M6IBI2_9BACT|nr:hypothetical protein SAMN05444280_11627 [Tangfeifania diversioriginum]